MHAITYRRFGAPEVLEITPTAPPVPRPGHLVVGVEAVSLNPLDSKIRRGELRVLSGSRFPKTPGMDFAGVVTAVGPQVTGFSVGDRVFGYTGSMRRGTFAEQLCVDARTTALVPAGVSLVDAAAASTVGVAALQCVRDVVALRAGESILVHGATGGVGLVLLQLARLRDARVTAVASARAAEAARAAGAERVIDYRTTRVTDLTDTYDVVVDLSTRLPFADVRPILTPRGRYVGVEPTPRSLLSTKLLNPFRAQKHRLLMTRPAAADLDWLAARLATGELRPPTVTLFDAAEVRRAFELAERGGVTGKVVLRFRPA